MLNTVIQGMEFKGVHPAVDGLYTQLLSAEQMAGVPADAYATMACCHALAQVSAELNTLCESTVSRVLLRTLRYVYVWLFGYACRLHSLTATR